MKNSDLMNILTLLIKILFLINLRIKNIIYVELLLILEKVEVVDILLPIVEMILIVTSNAIMTLLYLK